MTGAKYRKTGPTYEKTGAKYRKTGATYRKTGATPRPPDRRRHRPADSPASSRTTRYRRGT